MSALASNALVTVEEYKRYRGIQEDVEGYDEDRAVDLINAASEFAEGPQGCNRKFITPAAAVEEIFDGDGSKEYFVRYTPIVATALPTTPTLQYWDGSAWQTVGYTWTYSAGRGRVYFTDGCTFVSGADNYKLTYKYGYLITTVPADLKHAICQIVHRMDLLANGMEGKVSISLADETQSIDLKKLPENVVAVFERYRRY